jgi:hypothetical protein
VTGVIGAVLPHGLNQVLPGANTELRCDTGLSRLDAESDLKQRPQLIG